MDNFLTKNRIQFMVLLGNVFFLCLILIFFNNFTFLSINKFIDYDLLISFIVIIPFAWFFFFIKKNKEYFKKLANKFFKYSFFFGLMLILIAFLGAEFASTVEHFKIFTNFIFRNIHVLALLTICFGFFTAYFNSDKLLKFSDVSLTQNAATCPLKFKLKYTICLLCMLLVFIGIQIYKIYTAGIGTDEGNFLYTVKLLQQKNRLFLDFWIRESGSLIFLVPWFKLFEVSIVNLRWFIFLVHISTFVFIDLILNKISKNKKNNLFILLFFSIVASFNGPFDIYQAVFYKLNILLTTVIAYFYVEYLKKNKELLNIVSGLLCGLSIITYKGSMVILMVIPIILFLYYKSDFKKIFRKLIIFSVFTIVPVCIYWAYYSIATDFYHIFRLIIGDVLITIIAVTIFFIVMLNVFKKNKYLTNGDFQVLSSNFLTGAVFIYLIVSDYNFLNHCYVGLVLGALYIAIVLQLANIFSLKNYKVRIILIITYLIFNSCLLFFGFGRYNYYLDVPINQQIVSSVLFILYNGYLFILLFHKNYSSSDKSLLTTLFVTTVNIFFVITVAGSYIMPSRFQSILLFMPFLFLGVVFNNIPKKYFFIFLVSMSALASVVNNVNSKNNYYLYSYGEYGDITKKLKQELKPDQSILSLDVAILAQIDNKNIFPFSSPHLFNNKNTNYNFLYKGLDCKYPNNTLNIITKNLFDELVIKKPDIVITTSELPFRPYNYEYPKGLNYLNSNYETIYKNQGVWIFKKK